MTRWDSCCWDSCWDGCVFSFGFFFVLITVLFPPIFDIGRLGLELIYINLHDYEDFEVWVHWV